MSGLDDATLVGIQEDLYDAGYHPEDGPGLPYGSNNRYGSIFTLVAEAPSGARWVNTAIRFSNNLRIESDEEGFPHWAQDWNAGEQAGDLATYIQAFLDRGGKLNPKCWEPVQGRYGSEAWDEGLELMLEAEADGRWR